MTAFQILLLCFMAIIIVLGALHLDAFKIPIYMCTSKDDKCIDDCEACKHFKEKSFAYKVQVKYIQQMIRDLRDSENHTCPADENDLNECSCHAYDDVIDELNKLNNYV